MERLQKCLQLQPVDFLFPSSNARVIATVVDSVDSQSSSSTKIYDVYYELAVVRAAILASETHISSFWENRGINEMVLEATNVSIGSTNVYKERRPVTVATNRPVHNLLSHVSKHLEHTLLHTTTVHIADSVPYLTAFEA